VTLQIPSRDLSLLRSALAQMPFMRARKVWVFGSRARGDARANSDLDLLLDEGLGLGELGELREALEQSDISLKIDLVRMEDLSTDYRARIESDKILL